MIRRISLYSLFWDDDERWRVRELKGTIHSPQLTDMKDIEAFVWSLFISLLLLLLLLLLPLSSFWFIRREVMTYILSPKDRPWFCKGSSRPKPGRNGLCLICLYINTIICICICLNIIYICLALMMRLHRP